LLWGERSEGQARASLRQALASLRRALGEVARDALAASSGTVVLVPGSAWIDAREMESLAASGNPETLRAAADLIGGELMEGLAIAEPGFEDWLAAERERLRRIACGIHGRLMRDAERDGRLEEGLAHGLELLALDPLQEGVHRTLMRLYAAQRRHDAALSQYERCRRELAEQLGARPDAEAEELARSIRSRRRAGPTMPLPRGTRTRCRPGTSSRWGGLPSPCCRSRT
jgi:DNA-binding SARP family transcriptional activator